MDPANVATIVVALVAAAAAYASQRAASKATTMNMHTSSRVDMEREAYQRARAFDIETINRQDAEILELRIDNRGLHEKVAVAQAEAREARRETREFKAENDSLQARVAELERQLRTKENP